VFGRVWYHCQGSLGVCVASRASMTERVRLSVRSFNRWLKRLCEAGYLEDLTPGLRNRPHTYRDTGKARLVVKVEAEEGAGADATAGDAPENGRTESATTPEDGRTESPSTRTESPSRADRESYEDTSKRQSREGESAAAPVAPPSPSGRAKKPSKRDRRMPPAVRRFRKATQRYPSKSWYGNIAEMVGESPQDLEFWERVCHAWVGIGWNPTNVAGMLDFYQRREIPRTGPNTGLSAKEPAELAIVAGLDAAPSYVG